MLFMCSCQFKRWHCGKQKRNATEAFDLSLLVVSHSSRLTFTNPDKNDLGRYSVVVTDTDGVSSSYTLTEDGKTLTHKLVNAAAIWILFPALNPSVHAVPYHVCLLGCVLQPWIPCSSSATPSNIQVSFDSHNSVTPRFLSCSFFKTFFSASVVQSFLWNTVSTMRFWRKDTCVSGSRLSSCLHPCPTGSLWTTKKSPVGRYNTNTHCSLRPSNL